MMPYSLVGIHETADYKISEDSNLPSPLLTRQILRITFFFFLLPPYSESRSPIGAQGWLLSFLIFHNR
jgi:hypothetical protein